MAQLGFQSNFGGVEHDDVLFIHLHHGESPLDCLPATSKALVSVQYLHAFSQVVSGQLSIGNTELLINDVPSLPEHVCSFDLEDQGIILSNDTHH